MKLKLQRRISTHAATFIDSFKQNHQMQIK